MKTNCGLWRGGAKTFLCCAILQPLISAAQGDVLTYHNDNARTGQYLTETNLTLANVNTNSFGLLFSQPVDGQIYAQPLYLAGVAITNKGTHNVVFVATENDSVYAFDADDNSGSNAAPLWQASFLSASNGVTAVPSADLACALTAPVIGITSTPVIDPVSQTIYVEAKTKEATATATNYVHRLHALDLGSGQEKFGGPVIISPTIPGAGDYNDGAGNLLFNGLCQFNRSALLLANGVIYIAFGSHCDIGAYHGWIIGFNAQTLQPQGIYNSTPNGGQGGFWQGGDGPAADENGAIYAVSGNGVFDAGTNGDYGDSVVKLVPYGTNLIQADYFTPFDQSLLFLGDADLGSGGSLLLPDEAGTSTNQHLMLGGGKEGILYLVDRDNLGQFNPEYDQVVDAIQTASGLFTAPAYFNGMIYVGDANQPLQSFVCTNATLGAAPSALSQEIFNWPGTAPSISANGTSNAIVWAVQCSGNAILYAYNATNIAAELYNSAQVPIRDALGGAVKFVTPTIANGKVYVPTASALAVFGSGDLSAPPVITPNGGFFTNSICVTLSSPAPGTQIYYTLDGTSPTVGSTPYTGPIDLTNTSQVKALAVSHALLPSQPAYAFFDANPTGIGIAGFGKNGAGWTLNGSASANGDVLYLTDGGDHEAGSAFFNVPMVITNFDACFAYQTDGGANAADGAAFVIQSSISGPSAIGDIGEQLGLTGISPSVGLELHLFSGAGGTGTELGIDGASTNFDSTLPLDLTSGDLIWVSLSYDGTNLQETLLDQLNGNTYTATYEIDIAGTVETNCAWIGFVGADGTLTSMQTIAGFTFSPQFATPTVSATFCGTQITLNWNATPISYIVECTTNLGNPTIWTPVSEPSVASGNQMSLSLPIGATNTFYRLHAP